MKKFILLIALSVLFYSVPGNAVLDGDGRAPAPKPAEKVTTAAKKRLAIARAAIARTAQRVAVRSYKEAIKAVEREEKKEEERTAQAKAKIAKAKARTAQARAQRAQARAQRATEEYNEERKVAEVRAAKAKEIKKAAAVAIYKEKIREREEFDAWTSTDEEATDEEATEQKSPRARAQARAPGAGDQGA